MLFVFAGGGLSFVWCLVVVDLFSWWLVCGWLRWWLGYGGLLFMFGWFAVCLLLVNSVVLIVILDMLCLCLGL